MAEQTDSTCARKKREKRPVLILSTELSGGGAEKVARLMVENIDQSTCVLFENTGNIYPDHSKVSVIKVNRRSHNVVKLFLNAYRIVYIQIIKIKLKPAITVSHLEGPNFANILTWSGGIRVLFVHNFVGKNYSKRNFTNYLKKILIGILYQHADVVVGVSMDICDELVRRYKVRKEQVMYLPNPINTREIALEGNKSYGDWRDRLLQDRYIVNVGNFTEQKNHELLIHVFKHVRDRGVDVKLVLLGDGEDRKKILALCNDEKLVVHDLLVDQYSKYAEVFILGYQSNPYPIVRSAELFVMTSLWEGLPISLLEALCLEVPIVVSDCSDSIKNILDVENDIEGRAKRGHDNFRTEYGCFMPKPDMTNVTATVLLWSNAVIGMLNDSGYRRQCSNQSKIKADCFDIDVVSAIWRKTIFSNL